MPVIRPRALLVRTLCVAGLLGCDAPPEAGMRSGFARDGGASGPTPAYAALSSDYAASAIALLDEDGDVLADDYLTSASTKAGLVTALSGDVELPRASGEVGTLVIIDRFKTDVVTRVDLATGRVLGQVKTHTPATQTSTTAYTSNPFDYLYVGPDTAWVVRAQPNLDPMAPAIDRGDDLLRIDPATMTRTGDRIDLSLLDSQTTVVDPATGLSKQVVLYSRPARVTRTGQTLVVGITRTAYDFRAVGDGVVALVDLATRTVTPFELPGLKNCGGTQAVPGDLGSVLVTCSGDFTTKTPASTSDTAGLALLRIADGRATLAHVYRARDEATPRPYSASVVALGGTLVGAASNDYSGKGVDSFVILDLASGDKTALLTLTPGSGAFGTPTYNPDTRLLLLPDASRNADRRPSAGVRRFRRGDDGSFRELATVRVSVQTGMPIRHVYPL